MNISSIGSTSLARFMSSATSRTSSKTQGAQFDLSELASKIIEKKDTNGDGIVSADETGLDSEQFTALDTDASGGLTSDELLAALQATPPPPMMGKPMDSSEMASKILEEEDVNNDGTISADESKVDSARFNELDTDGNGVLTLDELQAASDSQKTEQTGGMPPPPGPPPPTSEEDDNFDSLLQVLAQNNASSAYASQSGLSQMLQSSTRGLSMTA